ncbi:hypothetical protein VTO42DRAFT_329 [Malbranchea cinnamomea]
MGNSQSSSTQTIGRSPNRLSKPPTNLPPVLAAPCQRSSSLRDETPRSTQSPWPQSPAGCDPLAPQMPQTCWLRDESNESPCFKGGLGDTDFDLRPDKKSPSSLSTRMGEIKRRFSTPERGRKPSQSSADVNDGPEAPHLPADSRRGSIRNISNPVAGLGLAFPEPTEGQGTRRYSAFRRLSLRTPGIATRVSEKLHSPRHSPKESRSNDYYDFHMYTDDQFTQEELSWLEVDPSGWGIWSANSAPYRASTPTPLEYSSLGGLKLGSLRVVNGCASPAPSTLRPRSLSESQVQQFSREDLGSPSKHEDSKEALHSSTSHHPHLIPSNVQKQLHREDDDDQSQIVQRESCESECHDASTGHATTFFLDGEETDTVIHCPTPIEPLELTVTSRADAVGDELFEDEAVDTSGGQSRLLLEEETSAVPTTGSSQHDDYGTKRRSTPCLSKSDSGYSSSSSKYVYSRKGKWDGSRYSSCSRSYCPDVDEGRRNCRPDVSKRQNQETSSDNFPDLFPDNPPDLSLTSPTSPLPQLDTGIPNCNGFPQSALSERYHQQADSRPLPKDVFPTLFQAIPSHDILQDFPPPLGESHPIATSEPSQAPVLTRKSSINKYLNRMKTFVNLRARSHSPLHFLLGDHGDSATNGQQRRQEGRNPGNSDESTYRQSKLNKLRRHSTIYESRAQTEACPSFSFVQG